MKEKIFKYLKIGSIILSLFNILMFFSMRCIWSGISKTLGYEKSESIFLLNLPVFICFILLFVFILNACLYFLIDKKKNLWSIIFSIIDVIFLIAIFVIIQLGGKDYMYFIWPKFFEATLIVLCALILIFFIFVYPKCRLKESKIFKLITLTCIIISTFAYLVNFSITYIQYKPVVYAVEDTYQIVFSATSESLGWVKINDTYYYDQNAGSMNSFDKVHKVIVPMETLDEAKSYTIGIQKMIYRGPFGGIKGNIIEEKYNFRPVDSSDGLNYYSLSDIHMGSKAVLKAANYNQEKEFLVIAGDSISLVDSYSDAQYINKIAHQITKGEIAVIHARGNHELKGKYAEQLYKYVGSKNNQYYFNFYLDGVYGIVLDIGEDHEDDYWEYYGTANYNAYREEQLRFLKDELDKKEFEKYDYRLAICHIPVVFVNSRKNHEYYKKEMTNLLNQMDIDMCLSGHQHDLLVFEPNTLTPYSKLKYNEAYDSGTYKGYVTDFNFPNLLISKRGHTQIDSNALTLKSHIGLTINVDFASQIQKAIYNTSNNEKVHMVNPFVDKDYQDEIEISLIDKSFK